MLDTCQRRLDAWHAGVRDLALQHPNIVRSLAALLIFACVLTAGFLHEALSGLPGKNELRALGVNPESSVVYDAHDKPVFSLPTQYRVEVPFRRMSPHLRNAIVAVEDARFYNHDGIDGIRVLGAVLTDLRERRVAEGASTITQQLARVSFLTREKTLRRKVREAVLAQRIEHLYDKDEILEIYLNKVYFGDGLFGAEAAARGYFGRHASDLTIGQAALLAGLVRSPSATNPTVSLERAVERRNLVLKLMRQHGFIDGDAYQTALHERVILRDNLRSEDETGAYFKELVRRQLIDRFGKDAVYNGRLRVYTTIDPGMQRAAEAAVAVTLAQIESRIPRRAEPLQAALLALDPATGEVRAIVGGRDQSGVGLNRALQTRRQPGSAFKPFVYAAALENGYSPASVIGSLNEPVATAAGAWLPEDEHSTADAMTIRTALRTSSNRAAVRMLEDVGVGRTVAYAERFGIGAIPSVPSLALGSGEVTLASMTSAYAAFAQQGIVRDLVFIRRVEDQNGTVLYQSDARPRRAVSEATAFLMDTMLADVIDSGTANAARRLGFALPAGGKTGTTNDFVDAWFIGFTPGLVAGVWVGFDQPQTIVNDGFAGQLAVPMWARFMKAATKGDGVRWFEPPPNVVAVDVCRISGFLPADGCRRVPWLSPTGELSYKSMVARDYFVRGAEPQRTCPIHTGDALPYSEPSPVSNPFDAVSQTTGIAPVVPESAPALKVSPARPETETMPGVSNDAPDESLPVPSVQPAPPDTWPSRP